MHADPGANSDAGEDEQLNRERSKIAAGKVVELGDGRRIEEGGGVAGGVLVGGLTGDRRRDYQSKERDVTNDVVQGIGRVHEDLATGSELDSGIGNSAAGHRRKQHSKEQEDQEIHVGGNSVETLAEFKRSDRQDHEASSPFPVLHHS